MIVGIDSGSKGAFAFIKEDEIDVVVMPLNGDEIDIRAISDMLLEVRSEIKMVILEDVFAMQKSSASSMLTFGRSHGKLEGILCALKIPYKLVPAKTWQKVMLTGVFGIDTKAKALKVASSLFPHVELKASARARNPHTGVVDALLIAEYGRRTCHY